MAASTPVDTVRSALARIKLAIGRLLASSYIDNLRSEITSKNEEIAVLTKQEAAKAATLSTVVAAVVAFADEVEGEIDSALPLPEALAGLVATAGDASVSLEWTLSTDSSIVSYQISVDGGAWTDLDVQSGNSLTTASVTGLINDQQYAFKVRAMNAYGAGPASAEVTATPVASE